MSYVVKDNGDYFAGPEAEPRWTKNKKLAVRLESRDIAMTIAKEFHGRVVKLSPPGSFRPARVYFIVEMPEYVVRTGDLYVAKDRTFVASQWRAHTFLYRENAENAAQKVGGRVARIVRRMGPARART